MGTCLARPPEQAHKQASHVHHWHCRKYTLMKSEHTHDLVPQPGAIPRDCADWGRNKLGLRVAMHSAQGAAALVATQGNEDGLVDVGVCQEFLAHGGNESVEECLTRTRRAGLQSRRRVEQPVCHVRSSCCCKHEALDRGTPLYLFGCPVVSIHRTTIGNDDDSVPGYCMHGERQVNPPQRYMGTASAWYHPTTEARVAVQRRRAEHCPTTDAAVHCPPTTPC